LEVGIRIGFLFERQFDVHPDGLAAGFGCAFIDRFHNPGTAAGDDGESILRQKLSQLFRLLIIFIAGLDAGRAKNRHGIANIGKNLDGFHKFGHDTKYAPRFFLRQCVDQVLLLHTAYSLTINPPFPRSADARSVNLIIFVKNLIAAAALDLGEPSARFNCFSLLLDGGLLISPANLQFLE